MRFPVHVAGRGGQYTYHGPGQRVVYAMLDLRRRRQDVRRFVSDLEEWTIRTLARFNVRGRAPRRPGRRLGAARQAGGRRQREDKIAAIGVRIRHWVSFHGISINVEPDLSHYAGIVPCGIAEHGVTSLVDLGLPVTMADLDMALARDVRRGVRRGASDRRQPRKALAAGSVEVGRRRRRPRSTRASEGPRRQASIMRPTAASSPTISASTAPSRRLRTQPARPRRRPVSIAQSR